MPRLPDVQSLGPRPSADPRLPVLAPPPNIIDAASDASIQTAAGQGIDQVAQRIYTRQDAIERARISEEYSAFADETARTFQTERDLTSQDTVNEYANLLKQKEAELLGTHRGSADSRANLQIKLGDVRSRYAGTFAGESIRAQRQRATDYTQSALRGIASNVYDDPGSFDDRKDEWLSEIEEMSGAFSQEEEFGYRVGGLSELALNSAAGYLDRGQYDQLDTFLARPDVAEVLSPADMRQIRSRRQAAIAAEAESSREFDAWMATLAAQGITPSRSEVLQKLGGYVAPQSPQVVVNNGGEAGPTFSKDGQQILVEDPSDPSGFRFVPIGGSEAAQAAQATESATALSTELAQNQLDVATRDISRIFDIIEESGGGTGPLEGMVGEWLPLAAANRMDPFIGSIKSMVVRDAMKNMRDSSPNGSTGFGNMTEQELKIVEDAQGRISTRMEERDLFSNLLTIVEGQAKASFGTDAEIGAALERGDLTQAEAGALVEGREQVVDAFRQRADTILTSVEGRPKQPQQPGGAVATANAAERPGIPQEQFMSLLRQVQTTPDAISADEVRAMGLSLDQLETLADAYDLAIKASVPGEGEGDAR